MARTPAPPGPPPPNYRPRGTPPPRSNNPLPGRLLGASTPPAAEPGLGPGAVTVIAVITLMLGAICGFFIGRASESDDQSTSAPPLTSPSTSETTRPPGDTIPQTTPGEEAPPSTDLDPSTIGTLEDPIPANQSYVLGLYEIEVRGATLDATDQLADFSPSNPPPPEGDQHALVEVAIRFNESQGVGNPAAVPFFLSDGVANWHDYDALCGSFPAPIALAGLIERGDEVVGNVCFTVPSDAVGDLLLGTEGFAGPVYFALP